MSLVERHIVVPYRKVRQGIVAGEWRPASSAEAARHMAAAMAFRFAGVAAYAVYVDEETGDMTSPVELARYGDAPALDA